MHIDGRAEPVDDSGRHKIAKRHHNRHVEGLLAAQSRAWDVPPFQPRGGDLVYWDGQRSVEGAVIKLGERGDDRLFATQSKRHTLRLPS